MIFRGVLSFCLLFSSLLFSEGTDLESCIQLRTRQYPIPEEKKILVGSPYRCGSTLLYNILRFLFEDDDKEGSKVVKIHALENLENSVIFTPLRNPLDACYSFCRVRNEEGVELTKQNIQNLVSTQTFLYKSYSLLNQKFSLSKDSSVFFLKYEDFVEDFDFLLSFLEHALHIEIDELDKEMVFHLFNADSILSHLDQTGLNHFSQSGHNTLLHGNHIATKKNDFSEELKEYLYEQILFHLKKDEKFFQKLGYEL